MTNTTYTASQAAARSKQYTSFATGYCLRFVKTVITPTVPSPYAAYLGTANAAWTYAKQKRTTSNPPAGAPVYWRSGQYGHIAVSLGNGYCRSTDYPSKGRVGTVGIAYLTRIWGMTYRGWSADYAGLTIPGLGSALPVDPGGKAVDLTAPIYLSQLRAGRTNTSVARFEKALWNWMGAAWRTRNASLNNVYGDGYWGTATTTTMRAAYARLGLPSNVDWPGRGLLQALGFKDIRS